MSTGPGPDLTAGSALEIAEAVRSGRASALEVAEAFLGRIARWRGLNACVLVDHDRALERARAIDRARAGGRAIGRLAGVPFLVKDNIEVAGQPCAAGTPALKDRIATRTAPAVTALLAEGAVLVGRSNMHELALGITNANAATGIARNPYDLTRIPGGSSGGAGAALAARLVPLALGTDTGASVRAPAAFCGVSALRPSVGEGPAERRYPLTGVVPLSPTRDTVGPMARDLADVAAADAAVTGDDALPDVPLARVRLGVPRRPFWHDLDREVAGICEGALRRIAEAGVTLVETESGAFGAADAQTSMAVTLFEFGPALRDYLRDQGAGITYEDVVSAIASGDVRALEALARTVSAGNYARAVRTALPALRREYRDYFATDRLDGCIFPTVPVVAPPIAAAASGRIRINGVDQPGGPAALFATVIRNLDANSLAGIPAVAFPAGLTRGGLPVGLEIDGPVGSDRVLLAIGGAIERLLGRIPPPPEIAPGRIGSGRDAPPSAGEHAR